MTAHFPTIVLSAIIAAASFGATPVMAQDAARLIPAPGSESQQVGTAAEQPAGQDDANNQPDDPDGNPGEAEARGLTSPDVTENSSEQPTDQGTRSTEVLDEENSPALYELLAQVRAAPPGLDGVPIPRPNPFASEPSKEMAPTQPEELYLFPDGYIE